MMIGMGIFPHHRRFSTHMDPLLITTSTIIINNNIIVMTRTSHMQAWGHRRTSTACSMPVSPPSTTLRPRQSSRTSGLRPRRKIQRRTLSIRKRNNSSPLVRYRVSCSLSSVPIPMKSSHLLLMLLYGSVKTPLRLVRIPPPPSHPEIILVLVHLIA